MTLNLNIKTSGSLVNQRLLHANSLNRNSFSNTSKLRTDWKENKMAVVNLEAALTAWKSIQNHKVSQASELFRKNIAFRTRLNPGITRHLPASLMRHYLG